MVSTVRNKACGLVLTYLTEIALENLTVSSQRGPQTRRACLVESGSALLSVVRSQVRLWVRERENHEPDAELGKHPLGPRVFHETDSADSTKAFDSSKSSLDVQSLHLHLLFSLQERRTHMSVANVGVENVPCARRNMLGPNPQQYTETLFETSSDHV